MSPHWESTHKLRGPLAMQSGWPVNPCVSLQAKPSYVEIWLGLCEETQVVASQCFVGTLYEDKTICSQYLPCLYYLLRLIFFFFCRFLFCFVFLSISLVCVAVCVCRYP